MTSLYITNSICTVWYRHATLKESQTLAKQGLMFFFFVCDCETPGSESEQLLQHSYHILKLRQCDGTVQKKKKNAYRFSSNQQSTPLRRKALWSSPLSWSKQKHPYSG